MAASGAAAGRSLTFMACLAALLLLLQMVLGPQTTLKTVLSRASQPVPAPAPLSEEEESHSEARHEVVSQSVSRRVAGSAPHFRGAQACTRARFGHVMAAHYFPALSERTRLNGCGSNLRC